MAEAALAYDSGLEPDLSHLVTEDDEPLDNPFSERQQKFLSDCLETSYRPGVPFVALVNVGIFETLEGAAIVPDLLLSLDAHFPDDVWEKGNRAYMLWRYGKSPELVIEIVSGKEGGEDSEKLRRYERMRVAYYVIYDPQAQLSKRPLRVYELHGARYVELADPCAPLEQLGLRLAIWEGTYAQMPGMRWLRLGTPDGQLLASGQELAAQERERAAQERERAERERERAERLAEKIRALGLDPETC